MIKHLSKFLFYTALVIFACFVLTATNPVSAQEDYNVYRVYNNLTGEHLYTPNQQEANNLCSSGWTDEGIAWRSPGNGEMVFRMFNSTLNEHLYTKDLNEVTTLQTTAGWMLDNEGTPLFYSGGSVPIYRLYNEEARMHHLTTDDNEYNALPANGWKQEGIAFYAVAK